MAGAEGLRHKINAARRHSCPEGLPAAGCASSKDLQLHDVRPRSQRGGEVEENPITLCSVCTGKFMPAPIVPRSLEQGEECPRSTNPRIAGENQSPLAVRCLCATRHSEPRKPRWPRGPRAFSENFQCPTFPDTRPGFPRTGAPAVVARIVTRLHAAGRFCARRIRDHPGLPNTIEHFGFAIVGFSRWRRTPRRTLGCVATRSTRVWKPAKHAFRTAQKRCSAKPKCSIQRG